MPLALFLSVAIAWTPHTAWRGQPAVAAVEAHRHTAPLAMMQKGTWNAPLVPTHSPQWHLKLMGEAFDVAEAAAERVGDDVATALTNIKLSLLVPPLEHAPLLAHLLRKGDELLAQRVWVLRRQPACSTEGRGRQGVAAATARPLTPGVRSLPPEACIRAAHRERWTAA